MEPELTLLPSLPNLDCLPALQAPPGKNPFHVKGVVANGFAQFASTHVRGGIDAVRREIRDPALRDYLGQTFFSGSWYDFLACLHFLSAAAAAVNRPLARVVAEHAAWQLGRDTRGVYRLLLLVASPEIVAPRMAHAFGRYFDFARINVVGVETGRLDLEVRGLPAVLTDWYKISVQAGAETVLGAAGASRIQSWYGPPEPDGKKGDVPLVRFRARRTWTR